jgi:hypothetical protein
MSRSLAVLLLGLAAPAAGQFPTPPLCTNAPVPGFVPGQARLSQVLTVGRAVELALKPADDVAFPLALARPAQAGTQGGVFPLEIKAAGTFRLLLSGKAWVDLVRDGAAVVSTEHSHGAPCSGVAKIVAFKLEPGRYQLQVSEAETRTIVVKVQPEAMIQLNDEALHKPKYEKPR